MNADEQAIRELVRTWLDATKRGDYSTVLSLMDDDVVFLVPGREPFGKEAWDKKGWTTCTSKDKARFWKSKFWVNGRGCVSTFG